MLRIKLLGEYLNHWHPCTGSRSSTYYVYKQIYWVHVVLNGNCSRVPPFYCLAIRDFRRRPVFISRRRILIAPLVSGTRDSSRTKQSRWHGMTNTLHSVCSMGTGYVSFVLSVKLQGAVISVAVPGAWRLHLFNTSSSIYLTRLNSTNTSQYY